jgi:hypothetical protein
MYMHEDVAVELPPMYFLITFWGQAFSDFFLRLTVPSLLSPGNIPALSRCKNRPRFLICTTPEDWKRLQGEENFRMLCEHIEVEFLDNSEAFPGEHKYIRMSRGHAMLTQRCFNDRAIAININPDSVYPDDSVAEAQRLANEGKHVLLCAAIRFEMEGVERDLNLRGLLKPGRAFALSKRDAVTIGLRNLHSESKASDWSAVNFGRLHPEHGRKHFLTCCLWQVPGCTGALVVTHNWAPFLIDYTKLRSHDVSALDGRALDGNYVFENFADHELGKHIHVVQDSDILFMLGLTPRGEMVPPKDWAWWRNLPVLGEWSRGYIFNQTVFDPGIDDFRRRIYQIPVRWHANDVTENWRKAEDKVKRLLEKYATADLRVGHGIPLARLEKRWQRRIDPWMRNR